MTTMDRRTVLGAGLAGRVLRVTPTGGVPAGSPFGSPVWTWGHRNVQGLAFDGKGRLWASELRILL